MEKVKLNDVLKYEQPTKYIVETENYNNDYKVPVLTAGKTFLLGYTDETHGIFDNVPVIIFDDFTTAFHYVDFPFKVKSSAMKILKAVEEKASLRYLYYKMQTISIDKDLHKRYWISKYSQIDIQLPNLATQQKIANILDKADELRQYNQQLIEKYDALTQSLFLDMFGDPVKNEKGWDKVSLGEICHKITDGTHKTPKYLENGVVFLSAKNVKDFKLNCSDPKFISKEEHKVLSNRCNVEKLDIVITKSGSLGMAAMVEFDFEFSIFESLALVKYKREFIIGLFLLYFLNTKSTQRQYNDITKGVGVKHLHLTDIRKLSIISPPIQLQNKFAERVSVIEVQKQQAQLELAKSEELFQSLLQRAFKGELN